MTRRYDNSVPVPRYLVDRLIDAGLRAPSAGFSQGWQFLVLDEPAAVSRYWEATAPSDGDASVAPADSWLTGMRTAPVLVVVYSDRIVYERRYARADKQRGAAGDTPVGPGARASLEERWPVAYWDVDAGMAGLLIQLAAIDVGLGCCWFGVPTERVAAVASAFAVPSRMTPVGVVSLGYPAAAAKPAASTSRPLRRSRAEVVSYGRFAAGAQ